MKIIKVYKNLKIYQVVNEDGDIIKEFDDYNYQKPYHQAKKFIEEVEKAGQQ